MRFKAYGLPFRGKSLVFPLALSRAALDASRFTFFKGKTRHPPIRLFSATRAIFFSVSLQVVPLKKNICKPRPFLLSVDESSPARQKCLP